MTPSPSHLGVSAEECLQETGWRQRSGGACPGKGISTRTNFGLSLVRSRKGGWFSAIPAGGKGEAMSEPDQALTIQQ